MVAAIDRAGFGRYYSATSWHCLFAGYGTFPDPARLIPPGADIDSIDLPKIDDFLTRCASNFGSHASRLRAAADHKDHV